METTEQKALIVPIYFLAGDLWITPAFRGTYASAEVCQLLLKHLFGMGYASTASCRL